jgi:hypothetical protein
MVAIRTGKDEQAKARVWTDHSQCRYQQLISHERSTSMQLRFESEPPLCETTVLENLLECLPFRNPQLFG